MDMTIHPDKNSLLDKVWYFGEGESENLPDRDGLFNDMLFREGGSTYHLLECKDKNGNIIPYHLPDILSYFSYYWFLYKIEDFSQVKRGMITLGGFDAKHQVLAVSPECLEKDSVILHEMIHMHEFVIDELPSYYRDTLLMQLHNDLLYGCPETNNKRLQGLEEVLKYYSLLVNQVDIDSLGGAHSILFLLKSLKLDMQMGYKLGTVFGYNEIMKDYLTDKLKIV